MLMAAEVSSLVRLMSRYKEEEKANDATAAEGRRDLVTRDLLGAGAGAPVGLKELDLDLKVPEGWEKRLDLVSGEVFFHRSSAAAAPRRGGLHDLNFPPPQPPQPPSLELKLFPLASSCSTSTSTSIPPADYQSVCTLDKVKSALNRLKHPNASPSPASSSSTTASAKRRYEEEEGDGESRSSVEEEEEEPPAAGGGLAMVAAGCPSCLSYVLVSGRKPRCPRCGAAVPMSVPKRRRFDLNLAAGGGVDGKKDGNL